MTTTSNKHFIIRARNMSNELLKKTDYYMLPDVYEILTTEQQQEIKSYRQVLRDFINVNRTKYLDDGIAFIEFPEPPIWTKIKNIKY
jgi:hypothetical protein